MKDETDQFELFDAPSDEEIGEIERRCRKRGFDWVVGADEAGRGPLAGPVQAAAVAMPTSELDADWLELLDDSKQLEKADRETAFDAVRERAPYWALEALGPEAIDELNILRAACRAMARAVRSVGDALGDGRAAIVVDGTTDLPLDRRHRAIPRADGRSFAVAAASILAKVRRDREMIEHHRQWPAYNFDSNKGYPTPDHRAALDEHGPCPIHRCTFSGVNAGSASPENEANSPAD
ncbi:MAG: ribonuclease HII [Bradymonadaceae bacterium]